MSKSFSEIKKSAIFKKNKASLKGFTLIELLVVIAIIGLLVVVGLVIFGPVREQAMDSKGESDLRMIMNAFEIKYHDQGEYPQLPESLTEIKPEDTRLAPYLGTVPYTNNSNNYMWYNGESNQNFCVLFKYKSKEGYFTCSHLGCQISSDAACPNF